MRDAQFLADADLEAFELAQNLDGEDKTHALAKGQLLATRAVFQRLDQTRG